MSRIGKKPILIPPGVEVKADGSSITVKGPKGELLRQIRPEISVKVKDDKVFLAPQKDLDPKKLKVSSAFWGLSRTLVANMVQGVTEGFEKKLEMVGIGYRAALDGSDLVLQAGFSHPVRIKAEDGIKFTAEKNIITVSGQDKELVGQMAAKIRKVRPPEPYKGKGIRYLGEIVRKKLGKKAAAASAAPA